MSKVYITGHRNPDLDSVCSAYAYSVLKNKTDSQNQYIPVRCGHLSETVKAQLSAVDIQAVPYKRDVFAKVEDVVLTASNKLESSTPIFDLVNSYDSKNPSAFPVFENGSFTGLLSLDDLMAWFLKNNSTEVPEYKFNLKNIEQVIPGKYIKKGQESFTARILAGAAALNDFEKMVSQDNRSVVVMGYRKEYTEKAIALQVPALILTATEEVNDLDFSKFKGSVYVTKLGTAETIRRLRMSVSIKEIMRTQGPVLQKDDLFEDGKTILASSSYRGLAVFDGDDFAGFVTRRCFLNKPNYKVILVDHNEVGQSIKGIETAEVKEIIDHHRLDALKTSLPIFIDAEPLGSTCTIVYQQFVRNSVVPDQYTSKVLLTGIISDTLILKSPTTTTTDRIAAGALAALSGIFDIQSYGEKLFGASTTLASVDPEKAILSDFKQYQEKGIKIGIGQCETTTLKDLSNYSASFLKALDQVKRSNGLDWAMLMVTNVLKEESVLLVTDNRLNKKLPYSVLENQIYSMPGVMSRKKQLLPEVLHTLD